MNKIECFGFINVNKPKGMSSHDVVYALRRVFGIKQIGHSGTLDPMASGVLVVGIGKATRLFEFLDEEKEYIATLRFGYKSDTLDVEGECIKEEDYFPREEELKVVLSSFLGELQQIPPKYSAIKVGGKKLYELARRGQEIGEIKARSVKIKDIELIEINENEAKIKVVCSKGTYIRSLVRDIAQRLGTVAIMSDLIRTKSGDFILNNSVELNESVDFDLLASNIVSPIDVLDFINYEINESDLKRVKNGMPIEFVSDKKVNQGEKILLIYQRKMISIGVLFGEKIIQKKVLV